MTLAVETNQNPPEITRRRFTLEEFERMSDLGLISEQHAELLNGEIYVKGMQYQPSRLASLEQSGRHSYTIVTLNEKMIALYQSRASVAAQVPLILLAPPPDFVEPDLMLRNLPTSQYANRNANSEDALLVIEVSDSTLERDQTDKLKAYARNGIPEYWILNLHSNQLEVYREPSGEEYLFIRKYKAGQAVAALEFPDLLLEWW
jgi:Uma2 family endonuclease